MVKEIITQNLILRKARTDDLYSIWNNIWRDERVAERMYWKPTQSKEEARDRLERSIRFQNDNDAFFICLKETDEAIGMAGIREESEGIYHERGICIAVKCQHRGYGRQVLDALLKIAFEDKKGKVFIYSCLKDNEASRKLALSGGLNYMNEETAIWEKDGSERVIENYIMTADDYYRERGDHHG